MRADELDHKELLELEPDGGLIRFAGQRALLVDAVAMGLLRKYLVAKQLGIGATTLYRRLKVWGLIDAAGPPEKPDAAEPPA